MPEEGNKVQEEGNKVQEGGKAAEESKVLQQLQQKQFLLQAKHHLKQLHPARLLQVGSLHGIRSAESGGFHKLQNHQQRSPTPQEHQHHHWRTRIVHRMMGNPLCAKNDWPLKILHRMRV